MPNFGDPNEAWGEEFEGQSEGRVGDGPGGWCPGRDNEFGVSCRTCDGAGRVPVGPKYYSMAPCPTCNGEQKATIHKLKPRKKRWAQIDAIYIACSLAALNPRRLKDWSGRWPPGPDDYRLEGDFPWHSKREFERDLGLENGFGFSFGGRW